MLTLLTKAYLVKTLANVHNFVAEKSFHVHRIQLIGLLMFIEAPSGLVLNPLLASFPDLLLASFPDPSWPHSQIPPGLIPRLFCSIPRPSTLRLIIKKKEFLRTVEVSQTRLAPSLLCHTRLVTRVAHFSSHSSHIKQYMPY